MRYEKMPPEEARKQRDFLERVGAIRFNYWVPPPEGSPDNEAWWENLTKTLDEAGEEFGFRDDPFVEAVLYVLLHEIEGRLSGEAGKWLGQLEGMAARLFENQSGGSGK